MVSVTFNLRILRSVKIHAAIHLLSPFSQFDDDLIHRIADLIGKLRTVYRHLFKYRDIPFSKFPLLIEDCDISDPSHSETEREALVIRQQVVEQFFLGIADGVWRGNMRTVLVCCGEIDLSVILDRLFDQIEIVLEDDPFSLVLRKQGIRSKHVPEIGGKCHVPDIVAFDEIDRSGRSCGRLHVYRDIRSLIIELEIHCVGESDDLSRYFTAEGFGTACIVKYSLLDETEELALSFLILFVIVHDQCIVELVLVQ